MTRREALKEAAEQLERDANELAHINEFEPYSKELPSCAKRAISKELFHLREIAEIIRPK